MLAAISRCPKQSSKAQSIEAKANLLRLTQEIRLNEDELRAVEDGIVGHEVLIARLASVPTPTSLDSSVLKVLNQLT